MIILKETSLASTITVLEITAVSKRLMSSTFAIIEIFVLAAVFYLVLNFIVLTLIGTVERRLAIPGR